MATKNRFGVDRFDLEHAMNEVRNTATDIQTVADMMYDSSLIYSEDRTHTVLSGLAEVLEAKCEKAELVFKKLFELDDYSPKIWDEQHFREQRDLGKISEEIKKSANREEQQYYRDEQGTLRWCDTDQPLESQLWDK